MTDAEILALRSAALNRVAKQLDAVRELHKPERGAFDKPWCDQCAQCWPCPTAVAAGCVTA